MCNTSQEFNEKITNLDNEYVKVRAKLVNKVIKLAKLYPNMIITLDNAAMVNSNHFNKSNTPEHMNETLFVVLRAFEEHITSKQRQLKLELE